MYTVGGAVPSARTRLSYRPMWRMIRQDDSERGKRDTTGTSISQFVPVIHYAKNLISGGKLSENRGRYL